MLGLEKYKESKIKEIKNKQRDMKKYNLEFEVRYYDTNDYESGIILKKQKNIVESFDNEKDAVEAGNKFLEDVVAKHFEVKDRFNVGEFHMVSNACDVNPLGIETVTYFVTINEVNTESVSEMIQNAKDGKERARKFKEEVLKVK